MRGLNGDHDPLGANLPAGQQVDGYGHFVDSVNLVLGSTSFYFGNAAAQFNRFFARTVGRPPGAYRDAFVRGGQPAVADPARPYDWP